MPRFTTSFAAVLLTAATASAADQPSVKDACVENTNLTEKACECLAGKSDSLSTAQRDYLVAVLTSDSAGQAKAQEELSVPQFAQVSSFIVNTVTNCQGD